MKLGMRCRTSERLSRTFARLACVCALALFAAGCAGVQVTSFPPPDECLTGEDVEFLAQLLGEQAVGRIAAEGDAAAQQQHRCQHGEFEMRGHRARPLVHGL